MHTSNMQSHRQHAVMHSTCSHPSASLFSKLVPTLRSPVLLWCRDESTEIRCTSAAGGEAAAVGEHFQNLAHTRPQHSQTSCKANDPIINLELELLKKSKGIFIVHRP